jgi:signal transduction histidine kinase
MNQPLILIVDDNPTNLAVLSDVLDQEGLEVRIAKNGKIALKRLEQELPDLILLDVMMPELNGFDTCKEIKANALTKDIPVIFMTALSDTEDKVKGFNLGAVDYITKPFQREELLARVKTHLQIYHLTQQVQRHNESLEEQVAERTSALEEAFVELQQAQTSLVQAEKMSSLGELVAGIAHEINNPVNFLVGNLGHAQNYIKDLDHIIKLYQRLYPADLSAELTEAIEEVELDYLLEDLPKLLKSMKVGIDRIQCIVKSLKTFSRMDESEVKEVDIHEGIDSTLMILQHRLKTQDHGQGIQVNKQYGELPLVNCYAGQLNQVFMNLLCNAIDAIEEKQKDGVGEILISTSYAEASKTIEIMIKDNGDGIPQEVQQRMFNPFFTTKKVGKGTGMGLPLSYSVIVDKHGGSLMCSSGPGEGTSFKILIPIDRQLTLISPDTSKHTNLSYCTRSATGTDQP